MSLVTGKGTEINFNNNVDLKKVFIRLKDGESVKVRVLGIGDYVQYKAHGDFNLKIYTQPCIEPEGHVCPLCTASKSGVEGFDKLYAKKRYLFAFADVDSGELKVWECSHAQAKDLIGQIKEYEDDINDIAFNFKRTGNKTETSYKLNPILKMKGDDVEKFHKFDDATVELSFFESVLVPRSEKMMLDILNEAGFPMSDYFPGFIAETPTKEASGESDNELPFN